MFDQIPKCQTSQSTVQLHIFIEKIKPSTFLRMINRDKTIIQPIRQNQEHQITINRDLYNEQLFVQDNDGMVQGVIPLEQLFFKQQIKGEYPLVNNIDGRFIGFIKLRIRNQTLEKNHQYIEELSVDNQANEQEQRQDQNNLSSSNLNKTLEKVVNKTIKREECLVVYIDELVSFSEKFDKVRKQLTANVYFKIMQSGQIIYKSEDIIHKFPVNSSLMISKLNNSKYIIDKVQPIDLQLASQGTVIASCVLPAYPYAGFLTLNINHSQKSKSQNNYALRLKVRVLRFPETEYQISRVLDSLCQTNLQSFRQNTQEIMLKQFKQFNKLTFTQLGLVQKVIVKNGKQLVFGSSVLKYPLNQDFIQQVLFNDVQNTGFLRPNKLQQIARLCQLDLKLEDKQKRKEQIDIVPIIYGMIMTQNNNPFSKNRIKERSAYQQIDNLHNQIAKKYK